MVEVSSKLFAELACVCGAQVDLVGGAVEAERHGLGSLAAIEIVYEQHLNLLCHGSQPFHWSMFIRLQTYTRTVAFANSHRR